MLSAQQIEGTPNHSGPAPSAGSGKKWLWTLVLLLVVAATAAVLRGKKSAAGEPGQASAQPTPVILAPAELTDMPVLLEGLGNVVPLALVTVKSQVDGRLEKVIFQEGQSVEKGQLLAQVDPRPFQIQLLNAKASLARDSAQLQNSQLNLDRYGSLRGQNLVSQQQVDDQRTLVNQTQAALQADQAAIQAAELQLDYAAIKSPLSGVTGVRLVDAGNLVRAADSTGIVVVTQLDPIGVMFSVPEEHQFRLAEAMSRGSVQVTAYSRDGSTELAQGQLLVIDNQINTATSTVKLKASFPNPDRKLWPNAFVKAKILVSTQKNAVTVPTAAIQQGPQSTYVYVVGDDHKAELRTVTVDFSQGERSVLSGGVQPGEQVVVEGQSQLRPQASVTVRRPAESKSADSSAASAPTKVHSGSTGLAAPSKRSHR